MAKTLLTLLERLNAWIAGLCVGSNLTLVNASTTTAAADGLAAGVGTSNIMGWASEGQLVYGGVLVFRLLFRQQVATRWQMVSAASAEALALLALAFWPSPVTLALTIFLAQFVGSTLGTLRIALRKLGTGSKHEALRTLDQLASYLTVTAASGAVAALKAYVGWGWGVFLLALMMVSWAAFLTFWNGFPTIPPEPRKPLRQVLGRRTVRWGIITNALIAMSFQIAISAAQLHIDAMWAPNPTSAAHVQILGMTGAKLATSLSWLLTLGRVLSLPFRQFVQLSTTNLNANETPEQHRHVARHRLMLCAIPLIVSLVLLQAAGFIPAGRVSITALAVLASFAFEAGMNGASPTLTVLIADRSAEAATANLIAQAGPIALGFWCASHLSFQWACVAMAVSTIATLLAGWKLATLPPKKTSALPQASLTPPTVASCGRRLHRRAPRRATRHQGPRRHLDRRDACSQLTRTHLSQTEGRHRHEPPLQPHHPRRPHDPAPRLHARDGARRRRPVRGRRREPDRG